MSQTYHLVCISCHETIWVGQSNLATGFYIYGPATEDVAGFLEKHKTSYTNEHYIVFVQYPDGPYDDEIDSMPDAGFDYQTTIEFIQRIPSIIAGEYSLNGRGLRSLAKAFRELAFRVRMRCNKE